MLLERIVDDPTSIPRSELQSRILRRFSGHERTQAVLEYCAIFRKHKHGKWVKNLVASSESDDVTTAVGEWGALRDSTGTQAIFYRWGGTGCELDGNGIKKILIYNNRRNNNKIRIGEICAGKLNSSNIFGDAEKSSGVSRRTITPWEVDIRSILDWVTGKDTKSLLPADVGIIAERLLQNEEINEREKDVLISFYDSTRKFLPSELVGEKDLLMLRTVLGRFRNRLDTNLENILWTNESVTRNQADPLITFVYEDSSSVINQLKKHDKTRREIEQARAEIDFYHPKMDEKGEFLLKYVKDYYAVNRNHKHRLSRLILPVRLYQSGLFMTEEDAKEIERTYDTHKDYTKSKLREDRDKRFADIRAKRWGDAKFRRKRELTNGFLERFQREIDESGISDELWRVINGVSRSKLAGTKTGYVTKLELLRTDPRGYTLAKNLSNFLSAGYVGTNFPIQDRVFCASTVEGNFPEMFIGQSISYNIPVEIKRIAFDDAQQIKNKTKAKQVLNSRKIAFDVLQDLATETLRRYRFR